MAGHNLEDAVLTEFLRSLGPWREFITIGGGYALIIYQLYLAELTDGNPPVKTTDIDSLISKRVPEVSKISLAEHLRRAGFICEPKDYANPATEYYKKEIHGAEIEIEFLTDNNSRENKDENIKIKGAEVIAQQLRYLELSLKSKTRFTTFSGESGFVVTPEAWIFHKGLTFTRRKDKMKVYKDLYGIWYIVTQLGTFSTSVEKSLADLMRNEPAPAKKFQKNIQNWMHVASPIDWERLESQDPSGNLRKEVFQEVATAICPPE